MDRDRDLDSGPRAGVRSLSRTSTDSSTTAFLTPTSPESSGIKPGSARLHMSNATPSDPLMVRSLSLTSWRPQYPRIGQFAMTPSEEVVAASPDGLIYFTRVQDHPSKPWSEPRPFPATTARLNDSTVTGLILHREEGKKGKLHVYCVADGRLHVFSSSGDSDLSFVEDRWPPFAESKVSGTPTVARIEASCDDQILCVVAPCESGGILCTSDRPSKYSRDSWYGYPTQTWDFPRKVAAHMGIISGVSVVVTKIGKPSIYDIEAPTGIVAACIASARLHTIEWPFERLSMSVNQGWRNPKCTTVEHPGEVTGNPVLLKNYENGRINCSLDLLVPSTEGGIFHFIRTPTSPDEWHMIGRIGFPDGVPMASSLACARLGDGPDRSSEFRAHVQCGGRLYLIRSLEGASPWVGSSLHPIEGPGPFPY